MYIFLVCNTIVKIKVMVKGCSVTVTFSGEALGAHLM